MWLLPVFLQQVMDTIRPVEMQYKQMTTRWQSSLSRGEAELEAEELERGRAAEERKYKQLPHVSLSVNHFFTECNNKNKGKCTDI